MEASKAVLREWDPDTLTAIANLASMYWSQGRRNEALVFQQTTVQNSKSMLGERHPTTTQRVRKLLFMNGNPLNT